MNDNNKTKMRFNIIDAIIILAFLAIAAAFIFRTPAGGFLESVISSNEFEYEFKITSIQKDSNNEVQVGDILYNKDTKDKVGTVTSVSVSPAEIYISLPTGEVVKKSLYEKIDMTLTIKTSGKLDKTGAYIGGTYFIAPGKDIHVYSKYIDFIGTVQKVKRGQ